MKTELANYLNAETEKLKARQHNRKQTLAEAGYKFVRYAGKGQAVFADDTGKQELFAANKNHASWGLRFNNTDWEFCSSHIPK